jgi:hypothetical protein
MEEYLILCEGNLSTSAKELLSHLAQSSQRVLFCWPNQSRENLFVDVIINHAAPNNFDRFTRSVAVVLNQCNITKVEESDIDLGAFRDFQLRFNATCTEISNYGGVIVSDINNSTFLLAIVLCFVGLMFLFVYTLAKLQNNQYQMGQTCQIDADEVMI